MIILLTILTAISAVLFSVELWYNQDLHRRLRDADESYEDAMTEYYSIYNRLCEVATHPAVVIESKYAVSVRVGNVTIRVWEKKEGERDYLMTCARELAEAINYKP